MHMHIHMHATRLHAYICSSLNDVYKIYSILYTVYIFYLKRFFFKDSLCLCQIFNERLFLLLLFLLLILVLVIVVVVIVVVVIVVVVIVVVIVVVVIVVVVIVVIVVLVVLQALWSSSQDLLLNLTE